MKNPHRCMPPLSAANPVALLSLRIAYVVIRRGRLGHGITTASVAQRLFAGGEGLFLGFSFVKGGWSA